jgi:hypothetical protein
LRGTVPNSWTEQHRARMENADGPRSEETSPGSRRGGDHSVAKV